MRRRGNELVGRDSQLQTLCEQGKGPVLLVVRGAAGSGRTALLNRFATSCADDGRVVLDLGDEKEQPAWDEFRSAALLAAARDRFDFLGGGVRLAAAIEELDARCVAGSYSDPWSRYRLLSAITRLFARIREHTALVVVADDIDRVPAPALALAPAHRAGHTVVVSCRDTADSGLCALADEVVDLAPLTDDEVGRLLGRFAAGPVDDAVTTALRENLGPLYGNPGALVSTVDQLREGARLRKVHGVLALRAPEEPIGLPLAHALFAEVDACGDLGRELVRRAADEELRLDAVFALAEATGHAASDYGRALDRLVAAGVLDHDATGRVRCRSRAVGVALGAQRSPLPALEPVRAEPADRDVVATAARLLAGEDLRAESAAAAVYHRVCLGYAGGDWTAALSAARELELMPDMASDDPRRDVARLLAAEVCGWRNDDRQAAAWLATVREDTPFPALRAWAATGLRHHAGDDAYAFGWASYVADESVLEEPGAAWLVTRLAALAAAAGQRYLGRAVLRRAEQRYAGGDVVRAVRGIVEGDVASLEAAERAQRADGTRFGVLVTCLRLASVASDPKPWLTDAGEHARAMDAARLVSEVRHTGQRRGVVRTPQRSRATDFSETERRIVALIREGKTNRQIAHDLRVSAKTVEKHLTRLFAKAGCRTRHALAMSHLGARAERVGA